MPETMLYPTRFQPYEGPCGEESDVLDRPQYLRRHPAIIQSTLIRYTQFLIRYVPKSRKVFRLIRSGIHKSKTVFHEHDIMLGTLKHRRTQPRSAAAETTTVARTRAMRTGTNVYMYLIVIHHTTHIYIYICIHIY